MRTILPLILVLALVSGVSIHAVDEKISVETMPPVVVKTIPQAGDTRVNPHLTEIKVTFSKEMLTNNQWSFVKLGNAPFPKASGKIHFLKDKRTCVLPVKLESGKTYAMWLNSGQYNYFKDKNKNSAIPYLLIFKTR